MIADTIANILFKALPAHAIPPKRRFSYENVPTLDAETLSVYCGFEVAGLSFFLSFELDTGRGGNRYFWFLFLFAPILSRLLHNRI